MENVSVLIVEDDIIESIRIENCLTDFGYHVLPVADNVKDALGIFYSSDPDITLIDINLKGNKDGIELGWRISQNQKYNKPIIYLTSLQNSQVFERAKATNPHAYLIKPVDPQMLQRAIELALIHANNKSTQNISPESALIQRDYIFVKRGKKMIRLKINNLNYIEVELKYCTLFTDDERYIIRMQLVELIDYLPKLSFQRVNRNYIVNLDKIKEFDLADMNISVGNTLLPISLKYKKDLMNKLDCIR
jgi:two-component system, LytTR family, response regulator